MPPAICDSEDDDDAEVLVPAGPSQQSLLSWAARQVDAVAVNLFDGADERTTGSTAQLQEEIRNAARCLFGTQTSQKSVAAAAVSPAHSLGVKRRHTAALSPQTSQKSNSAVKRARTNAYSMSPPPADIIAHLPADNREPSPTFSDHSDAHHAPSSAIPDGTMLNAFREHEPAVMFRDTGDTVPDDESCRDHMASAAIAGAPKQQVESQTRTETQQSDSFPYSLSVQTTQRQTQRLEQDQTSLQPECPTEAAEAGAAASLTNDETQAAADEMSYEDIRPRVRSPRPSPRVIIPRLPSTERIPPPNSKRKPTAKNDDSEDEIVVGLPAELYKPRPSRRRATHAVDEHIDLSVAPERAAKRRRKTAEDSASVKDEPITFDNSITSQLTSLSHPTVPTTESSLSTLDSPLKLKSESAALPSPAPKSKAERVRRSQTTIFEDHISPAKSPTLRQQQAARRSALRDISNAPSPARKRFELRDSDDEEDELARDEHSPPQQKKRRGRPPKAVAKTTAAKEKGELKSKSAAVVEDSDEDELAVPPNEDDDKEREEEKGIAVAAPQNKKRGRGRPAKKAKLVIEAEDSDEEQKHAEEEDHAPNDALAGHDPSTRPASPRKQDFASSSPSAKPTTAESVPDATKPSSKPPGPSVSVPALASSSTPSGSAGANGIRYRVGLSKRHRIPSLHANIRRK